MLDILSKASKFNEFQAYYKLIDIEPGMVA